MQNISVITTCFIYFVGIRQLGVSVTTGTLIAFIGYINNFWNPVINIGNFYNSLITATAYLERIFETMDVVPEIQDAPLLSCRQLKEPSTFSMFISVMKKEKIF